MGLRPGGLEIRKPEQEVKLKMGIVTGPVAHGSDGRFSPGYPKLWTLNPRVQRFRTMFGSVGFSVEGSRSGSACLRTSTRTHQPQLIHLDSQWENFKLLAI